MYKIASFLVLWGSLAWAEPTRLLITSPRSLGGHHELLAFIQANPTGIRVLGQGGGFLAKEMLIEADPALLPGLSALQRIEALPLTEIATLASAAGQPLDEARMKDLTARAVAGSYRERLSAA